MIPPSARSFAERQVGLMVHQGHIERARVTLAKLVDTDRSAAEPYLDGIRMELTVNPEGEAWGAWLLRGLRAGAPLAGDLFAVVPRERLSRWLPSAELSWRSLSRQADRGAALDLLRLHLQGRLLRGLDASALELIAHEELQLAAREHLDLREVVAATLSATAWTDASRSRELAQGAGLEAVDPGELTAPSADPRALLWQVVALQPERAQLRSLPEALDRFLRLSPVVGPDALAELVRRLPRELAARSDAYVAAADAMAAESGRLASWLIAALHCAVAQLGQGIAMPDADERGQIGRRLADAAAEARSGLRGMLFGLLRVRHGIYRDRLRPRLQRAVMHHRCTPQALLSLAAPQAPLSEADARSLLEDRALELLGTVASLDRLRPGDQRGYAPAQRGMFPLDR